MEMTSQPIKLPKSQRNDLLKIIALLTMLIDHTGMLYFPDQMIFRTIGRIAFPIFAYQIALGFQMTSSRFRYGTRLFIFACISQIPYFWFNPEVAFEFGGLNIMFTFFFALLSLECFELGKQAISSFIAKEQQLINGFKAVGFFLLCVAIMVAPEVTRIQYGHGIEYGISGILFVFLFYFLGKQKLPLLVGYIGLSAFSTYYSMARYYYTSAPSIMTFLEALTSYQVLFDYMSQGNNNIWALRGIFFQSRSIMAVPIIWGGNYLAQLGYVKVHLNKFVGYWFYPVHIGILLLLKVIVFN